MDMKGVALHRYIPGNDIQPNDRRSLELLHGFCDDSMRLDVKREGVANERA